MKKNKILIIEDDLIDQMAFTRMFDKSQLDIECFIANSILNAKSELANQHFDLVVSDYNLADGTPFDLIEDIVNIPLIIISGNEDKTIINNLISSFFNYGEAQSIAYLTKDINLIYLNELLILAREFLAKKTTLKKLPKIESRKNNPSGKIFINLKNVYQIFDNNKKDIKEAFEIFIEHKPQEFQSLLDSIDKKDCNNVLKITHRMKSGFRVLGMKIQENRLDEIDKITESSYCYSKGVNTLTKQLSIDLEEAIIILKKEITLLKIN